MESFEIICPVCGTHHAENVCPACGFAVRKLLSPALPAMQEAEERRIAIAKEQWNKFQQVEQRVNEAVEAKKVLEHQVEELNGQLSEKGQQIEALNTEKATLESQKTTLENEKAALSEQKTALEGQKQKLENEKLELTNKKAELETEAARLKAELEVCKNQPAQPVAVGYLVQMEDSNVIGILPISKGKTIVGRSPMKVEGINRCRIASQDSALQKEHFSIETTEDNGNLRLVAKLLAGQWSIDYPGNQVPSKELSNETRIIIGDVQLVFILP